MMEMSTDLTFGQKLLESLEQAVAYNRGEYVPPRVHRVPITARHASVAAPPRFDAAHIQSVRRSLALSQGVFAAALGVSPSTVRAWEQGDRIPEGASRRLLQIAEEHPEYFAQMAQAAGK
jgi:putative transcriptional regulator